MGELALVPLSRELVGHGGVEPNRLKVNGEENSMVGLAIVGTTGQDGPIRLHRANSWIGLFCLYMLTNNLQTGLSRPSELLFVSFSLPLEVLEQTF
jgi:hypothetical protein